MSSLELPRYVLPQIAGLRTKLWEFFRPYVGSVIKAGIDYDSVIVTLLELLPAGIDRQTLTESLYDLVQIPLTAEKLKLAVYRIAGNIHRLKSAQAVLPWRQQPEPEWVPFEFTDQRPHITKQGKRGLIFTYVSLAGSPAGVQGTAYWRAKFCYVLAEQFGFSKSWGKYPMGHGCELVGLQFYGKIDTNTCLDGELKFSATQVASGMLSRNRTVISSRSLTNRQAGKATCPYKFGHACYQCFVGCKPHPSDNRMCQLAVHATTYPVGTCRSCSKQKFLPPTGSLFGDTLCESCRLESMARKAK